MVWKNKGDKENNTFVVGAPEKEEREKRERAKKTPIVVDPRFFRPLVFVSLSLFPMPCAVRT